MATLFISCPQADKEIAQKIEKRLKVRGHIFKQPYGFLPPGNWREKLQENLQNSDAVIIVLTERGLRSPYVLGEVGMARAYSKSKSQLILPVLVELQEIPDFIDDIGCFELHNRDNESLDALSDDLNEAIVEHVSAKTKGPRIFISHRHKDEPVVSALVAMLESAFVIDKNDIRCTSLKPYALPVGERVSERLRADLNQAKLVIGVISPEISESRYVLFELGAAWVRGIPTFPVLVGGASDKDVPGPLGERHSISLDKVPNGIQLIDDLAEESLLERRGGVAGRVATEAEKLVSLALAANTSGPASPKESSGPTSDDAKVAQHISNYLNANEYTMISFERVRDNINANYSDAMLIALIDKMPDRFRRARLKGGKPGLAFAPKG